MGNEGDSVPAGTLGQRVSALVPWFVCLTIFGVAAVALDGLERAIAVGAFSASCFGAMLATSQVHRAAVSMRRWMGDRESALSTFADDRAAEQRVADLTRTLRQVATTVSSGGEGLGPVAPRSALTFDWTLEYDGSAHSLRLRSTSADLRPSNARILDATGRLVVETSSARQRRPAELLLQVPQTVAAAVESSDWSALQLEAELDGVWHAADLVDRAQPLVRAEVAQPRSLRVGRLS